VNANTGASTLNITGIPGAFGAKNIYKNGSAALISGDLSAGQTIVLSYDGTNFQILGGIASGSGGSISGLSTDFIPVATSSTVLGNSNIKKVSTTSYYLDGNTNGLSQFGTFNGNAGSSARASIYSGANGASSILYSYNPSYSSSGKAGNLELQNFTSNGNSIIQTSISGAIYDRFAILGRKTNLTEGSATAFATINIPSLETVGGYIIVTVQAGDGVDVQDITQRILFNAVNKSGTLTISSGTAESLSTVSTGTLTATITFVDAGSGNLQIKANATSSLTQTYLRAQCFINKNIGGDISAN
jgi:hypothetical protein